MSKQNNRIGVMDFQSTCRRYLTEYGKEARIALNDTLPEAAKIAVKMIRGNSKKRTGKYAADWTYRRQYYRGIGSSYVVFNRDHYRVAHLLENSHGFSNQYGRTGKKWVGDHVIKDVETYVESWLEDELIKRLGGAG